MADFGFEWQDTSDNEELVLDEVVPTKEPLKPENEKSKTDSKVENVDITTKQDPSLRSITAHDNKNTTQAVISNTPDANDSSVDLKSVCGTSIGPGSMSATSSVGPKPQGTIPFPLTPDSPAIPPVSNLIPSPHVQTQKPQPPPNMKINTDLEKDTDGIQDQRESIGQNNADGNSAPPLPPKDVRYSRGKSGSKSNSRTPKSPTAEATAAAVGVAVEEILEPRIADPSKDRQVLDMEKSEANLTPLQIIVRRSSSLYVYQRVWSTKEVCRLLQWASTASIPTATTAEAKKEQKETGQNTMAENFVVNLKDAFETVIPIAMRLIDDPDTNVKEAMVKNLEPVLKFYYLNVDTYISTLGEKKEREKRTSETNARKPSLREADEDEMLDSKNNSSAEPNSTGENDVGRGSTENSNEEVDSLADSDAHDGDLDDRPSTPLSDFSDDMGETATDPEAFRTWLQNILLSTQSKISIPAQKAVVNLGKHLSFTEFHTNIIHGVILGLIPNEFEQQMQRARSSLIKSRSNSSEPSSENTLPSDPSSISSGNFNIADSIASSGSGNNSSNNSSGYRFGFASLFGIKSTSSTNSGDNNLTSESEDAGQSDQPPKFVFVSPQEEEARAELIRRKLLLLHMIFLTAVEYGKPMRLAVFVPVVDKASKDTSYEVRRDAAAVIGALSKAISYELAYDMMFPCFVRLVNDRIWQVRESAARHSFAGIASVVGPQATSSVSAMLAATGGSNTIVTSPPRSHGGNSSNGSISSNSSDSLKTKNNRSSLLPNFMSLSLTSNRSSTISNPSTSSSAQPPPHRRQTSLQILGDSVSKATKNKHWSTGTPSPTSSHNPYLQSPPLSQPLPGQSGEPRVVSEKQWQQLIDRLTGTSEPSTRVRSAFFESIGKILIALTSVPATPSATTPSTPLTANSITGNSYFNNPGNNMATFNNNVKEGMSFNAAFVPKIPTYLNTSPKLRDSIIELLTSTVSMAYNKTGYSGGRNGDYYDDADSRGNGSVPSEIIYHIAFNFPAVAAVLGREGWPRIRETYQNLVKMDYFDVRKTLAASIHEIAKVSGDQEETLCIFLMEPPEIRKAILQNLDMTLASFSLKARERCLPIVLQVFSLEGKDWRTRKLMAAQLVSICSLYPPLTVVQKLLPLAVKWANDPVSGVRMAVSGAFPVMFSIVKDDPNAQVPFFEHVISFAKATTFRGRLFFIDMCTSLVLREDPDSDPLEFDQFFLPSLAHLSKDQVVNVRIGLARLVAKLMGNKKRRRASLTKGESMRGELLADMIDNLKNDEDRDVKDMLKNLI